MRAVVVHVAPRIEPSGHHRDRFDAYLGGELVHTGKQVIRPVARALLARGYDPETLLTMWAEGASGASFKPRSIAEWAAERLVEKDRGGFRVEPWTENPFENASERVPVGAENARDGSADTDATRPRRDGAGTPTDGASE